MNPDNLGIANFFIFFAEKQTQQSSTVKIISIFLQQPSLQHHHSKYSIILVGGAEIVASYLPLGLFLYNLLRIQQSLMADNRQQTNTHEFVLKVLTVKMKIKFPCKMTLQFNKQTITKQAPSSEYNRFIFNEEIVLRGDQDSSFQIFTHLYTEKGTKYTSGVFKLLAAQLKKCQISQKLIVPLSKCLDPDAFCEIRIEQVIDNSKASSRISRAASKVINSTDKPEMLSPQTKKINSEKYLIGQTRSEIGFGQVGGLYNLGSEQNRARETTKTQILKTFAKSPNSKFSNMKYVTMNSGNIMKNLSQFPVEQVGSQRPSFAETEVYREGYYKLKQKFKKESQLAKQECHKRMLLEANQNNFKLEIMKLKLKTEQQQKQIIDKNQKIKSINNQLIEFQKKDIDIVYLKEQNANLERKLKISEQNAHIYQQDIESIKKLMGERLKLSEENLAVVKNQLEFAKAKIEEQRYEFDSEIKAKDNIIVTKNNDLKMRADTIERQKKLIKQLQEQAEARMFDFEKSLMNERTSLQSKIDEIKSKRSITQKEKDEVCRENRDLKYQIQKLKDQISLLEYNKKILSQQNLVLTQEIQQLKLVKQKHGELQKEYKFLQEQFQTVRKNLQVAVQNKEINITQLANKFEQGKYRHERIKAEYDQRIKSLLVKTQQMELTIETSKNSFEKNKRTIDFQTKEIAALRQQNSSLRDQLKVAQRRIISLEGEYSTNSNTAERQKNNFQFLLYKLKEDKLSLQKQNDIFRQKLEKSQEKLKQCQVHFRQSKAKQRHLQQRLEKQSHKIKENQTKYQVNLKENQNTILELNSNIDSLEKEVRKNVKKINQYQLLAIKTKETHQLLKKDIKLSEEKISSLQSQLKTKNQELYEALQKNKTKQLIILQKEHQISKLRQEIVQYSNKSTKQEKMIELLNSEAQKLKKNGSQLQDIIAQRQKNEERLRQEIKSVRDQHVFEKNRSNKIQAEFDKFKDSINDIISIEFTRLLSLPTSQSFLPRSSQRLRESQISNGKSQRSRVRQSLDASQIASTLMQKINQSKNSLWKMVQLNKALKKENQNLLQQSQSQTNRHEFDKLELHRDIQLLQDEMNNIISDKEVQNLNYDNMLHKLSKQIKQKEQLIVQMKFENEELNAINTGLKTDFQANNELNDKKVNNLKLTINELNQKIEYLNFNLGCLEDKNHELEQKTNQQENQIINHKQMLIKYEKTVQDTKESQEKLAKEIEAIKKEYKLLNEKYSEQQILINSQKQTNQKYLLMIEQQQKKVQKLNQFIKSLILQKENAIKNQLQKSEEVNTLQTKNFELTHQNEVLQDQNQVSRKKIEEFKEEIKNLNKSLKQFEKNLTQEKSRHTRSQEKIKQRENDLEIKKEYIKDLQERYRELRDKNYKEIKELSNELEDKSAANLSQHKQLNDQILKLESQSKRLWQQNLVLKSELEHLTKQIYKKNDIIQDLQIEIKTMRDQKLNLQEQLASKQFLIHQKVDEIHKLEVLFESERINFNNLSNQYQVHEKQFNLNINQITNEYNFKLETTEKEYQQKLQLNKRQLEYVKDKLRNTEEQLIKIQLDKKSQEIDFEQTKKNFEQKIKKIENERLSTTLAKNNEIKKISEESKLHFERFRQKEAQLRKLNLELQQVKLRSGRSQQFNSHSIQQGKTKEKLLQKEIESYKKKQEANNNYKKRLLESIYKNEGDVRKIIANTMKKLTQICNKADSEKILGVVKGLEGGVVSAMMANLQTQ